MNLLRLIAPNCGGDSARPAFAASAVLENNGTWVNVRGCANFKELDVESSNLTEIILDGCTSLKDFSCGDNRLSALNMAGFNNLESLSYENQEISVVSVSRKMNFSDIISAGIENVDNVTAYDAQGNEIEVQYDKETGIAEFARVPA